MHPVSHSTFIPVKFKEDIKYIKKISNCLLRAPQRGVNDSRYFIAVLHIRLISTILKWVAGYFMVINILNNVQIL